MHFSEKGSVVADDGYQCMLSKMAMKQFQYKLKEKHMHICRQQLHINNLIRHKQLKKTYLL